MPGEGFDLEAENSKNGKFTVYDDGADDVLTSKWWRPLRKILSLSS